MGKGCAEGKRALILSTTIAERVYVLVLGLDGPFFDPQVFLQAMAGDCRNTCGAHTAEINRHTVWPLMV